MTDELPDISEAIDFIEQTSASLLAAKTKEHAELEEHFFRDAAIRSAILWGQEYPSFESEIIPIDDIVKKLQQRFSIKMSLGTMIVKEDYRPWLQTRTIDWYYWSRYRKYLARGKNQSPYVIRSVDYITEQILGQFENPEKMGYWNRRGMVVGYVQSGKTANYIGAVCKAADAGYKVIIVLAGTLNALRNQTQERVDQGFIGMCTTLKEFIGSGLISNIRKPVYFTTSTRDFSKNTARVIGVGIGDLKEPAVLVIKKNKTTLENLISWLKDNNPHKLQQYPMLLIDDEADHASINTRKEGEDAPAINAKIRELIKLFDRSSYVGYTATPFANIFIDPDSSDEMLGDDLFPRDFILTLDPPDNYIGPGKIFSENPEFDLIREIDDNEDVLPIRHKKEYRPESLAPSLRRAIKSFILIRAIRDLRGQKNAHNSMMINVSRFTKVQTQIKLLVSDYLKEILRPAINNHCMLPEKEALKNAEIRDLKCTWEDEFISSCPNWIDVQHKLFESVSPIQVIEVNISPTAETLDYSDKNYPGGRQVIVVGGMGLSRGLTLEGLTVSYFLRNSLMYDTLMQMGRWFGYRDGYADLCRIFMPSDARNWYSHISSVIEELQAEFRRMKEAKMTPSDFGLCVRSHPESLIVTARNKMRTGKKVIRQIDLTGRLIETAWLYSDNAKISRNIRNAVILINKCKESSRLDAESGQSGMLFHEVPSDWVREFVSGYINHPAALQTQTEPVINYIQRLKSEKSLDSWDVLFVSVSQKKATTTIVPPSGLQGIIPQVRKKATSVPDGIMLGQRKVSSGGAEEAGLTNGETRKVPILMVHLLDCRLVHEQERPLFNEGIIAYGIKFPGLPGSGRPQELVSYVVNAVWWDQEYGDSMEDEDELPGAENE